MHDIWTTHSVAEPEQFAFWREAVSNAFVPLEPAGQARRFDGQLKALTGHALQVATVMADPHLVRLTPDGIRRRSQGGFFVNLVLEGEITIEQFGKSAKLRPGDIYLLDTDAPFSQNFMTRFQILCVTLDPVVLRHHLRNRQPLPSPVLRGDQGLAQLVAHYMQGLQATDTEAVLGVQDLAAHHLGALLANATTIGTGRGSLLRTRRRATLQRIYNHIEANLDNEDLSVSSTCEALGISRSTLYSVLADAGHSFSNYVRNRRLDECRRQLRELPRSTITDIAGRWGFSDHSSFTRMFKARFGETPSEARARS